MNPKADQGGKVRDAEYAAASKRPAFQSLTVTTTQNEARPKTRCSSTYQRGY